MTGVATRRRGDLVILLGAGFALRLGMWWLRPNVHWPDEVYQVLEPAHRLVFGYGIPAWEWIVGIRSWLLPGIIAGTMELGRLFGGDPETINLPFEIGMAALGCIPVYCGYRWGEALIGRSGAVIAGFVNAVWSDLVYMSPHTLNEVVAADLLILALWIGWPGDHRPKGSRLAACGAMLGLVFAFRFHLAPALLLAAIMICGQQAVSWRLLLTGAAMPVLGLAVLDWVTLSWPLQSVWLNVWYNVIEGVSREYGVDPWWLLPVLILWIWLPAMPAIAPALWLGARRLPLLGWLAATIIASHCVFAHKEYRFIYPAIPLLTTLIGLGSAEIAARLGRRLPERHAGLATPGMILAWAGLCAMVAFQPFMNPAWTRSAGFFAAFRDIRQLGTACAVATNLPIASPGSAWLPPGVPFYQTYMLTIPYREFARTDAAFNVILTSANAQVPDQRYHRGACFAGNVDGHGVPHLRICVWQRPGGCDRRAAPAPLILWPDYFRARMGLPPFDYHRLDREARMDGAAGDP